MGNQCAGQGAPSHLEPNSSVRPEDAGHRAERQPLGAAQKRPGPDGERDCQVSSGRQAQRSALSSLPAQGATADGLSRRLRRGYAFARALAPMGATLPHRSLRGTRTDHHVLPRRHRGHASSRRQQRSRGVAQHQGPADRSARVWIPLRPGADRPLRARPGRSLPTPARPTVTVTGPTDMPEDPLKLVPELLRLNAAQSVYDFVSRFFRDPQLRTVFSFHPLFIGGNPFRASAIYSIVPYLERLGGVHFTPGGMYSLVEAMERLFGTLGG